MLQFEFLSFCFFKCWVFECRQILNFYVWSQFEFVEFCKIFSFWVSLQFEFLSFCFLNVEFLIDVKIGFFKFGHNLSLLNFVIIWIFEFRRNLSIWFLLQDPAPTLHVDCWITTVFFKQGYWILTPKKLKKNVIIQWHAHHDIICWPNYIKRIFCQLLLGTTCFFFLGITCILIVSCHLSLVIRIFFVKS